MRRRTMVVTCVLALSVGTGPTVTSVAAGPYTFTSVVDDSGPFSGIGLLPTINGNGEAIFFGVGDNVSGGLGVEGLYRGNGGPLTTIASDAAGPLGGFHTDSAQGPRFNDAATAAFIGTFGGDPYRVYTGNGGALQTVAREPDLRLFGIPDINNSGQVAFWGGPTGSIGTVRVANADGSGTPVDVTTVAGTFMNVGRNPDINDSGTVAFAAGLLNGNAPVIIRSDGTTFRKVADRSTAPFDANSSFGDPVINNAGTVAFVATIAGGAGVFVDDGQALTMVIRPDDAVRVSQFNALSINDDGTVAFIGILADGKRGIFTGPDPVADKVVVVGDQALGGTLGSFEMCHGALNNAGQVAFRYGIGHLGGGAVGVAIASPVPEPSMIVAGACALLITQLGARRRRV